MIFNKFLILFIFTICLNAKDINAVFFITEKDQINKAFILATSLQKTLEVGENADIEVIIGGSAVSVFNSPNDLDLLKKINDLSNTNSIRVVACKGALKRANIDIKNMPKKIELIRAAPREFVIRQLNGYAILEP